MAFKHHSKYVYEFANQIMNYDCPAPCWKEFFELGHIERIDSTRNSTNKHGDIKRKTDR
jgi:hypothetical protein